MKIQNVLLMALAADARAPQKQFQHLEKASSEIFDTFFIAAEPNIEVDPAHANPTIKPEKRRTRKAEQLKGKYEQLNGIFSKAMYEDNCYPEAEQRTRLTTRFDKTSFKKAITQITKNYIKLQKNMNKDSYEDKDHEDYSKACKIAQRKLSRKVPRFNAKAKDAYCAFVWDEEWCQKDKDIMSLAQNLYNRVD
jgi:hypothetical protein